MTPFYILSDWYEIVVHQYSTHKIYAKPQLCFLDIAREGGLFLSYILVLSVYYSYVQKCVFFPWNRAK